MKNWLKNIQVGIEDFLNCYENGEENKKPERKVYIMLWALTIFMGILSGYLIYCTYEIYKKSGWQSLYIFLQLLFKYTDCCIYCFARSMLANI